MTNTIYLTREEIIDLYARGYLVRPKISPDPIKPKKVASKDNFPTDLDIEVFMLYDKVWSGEKLNG